MFFFIIIGPGYKRRLTYSIVVCRICIKNRYKLYELQSVNMEQLTADDRPPAYSDVVLIPMPFPQAPLPEFSGNTVQQETGNDTVLMAPEPHQPHEPPPSAPPVQPPTYTQPPPAYSLHAPYYISAPLSQQQNQQHQQQQVVLSTVMA